MEGQKIWNNILSQIKSEISVAQFKTWFSGSRFLRFETKGDSELFVVSVKNNFQKEQIESRYSKRITDLAVTLGVNINLKVLVSQKESTESTSSTPIFSGVPSEVFVSTKNSNSVDSSLTFENFVVGQTNNLAYYAANQIATNLGSLYNPFLVFGQTGVGKTHILHAIGNEALTKISGVKVVYATAEKFTNDYIDSLRNKTQESFRAKYRRVDVLLVDDVQFLMGKESTQDEFFHTFNELVMSGKQVVLASDRHPKELSRLRDRLTSRFLGGMVAQVSMPDLEMLIAIVKIKCQRRGIELTNEVAAYISQECQGVRELEGNITSVIAIAQLSGGSVSLDAVRSAIVKRPLINQVLPNVSRVLDVVCRHFKVSHTDLKSSSRKAKVVSARQMLMYLLRSELGMPLSTIGDVLGGRDHSTVIYGIGKVKEARSTQTMVNDEFLRLRSQINSTN